jgi:hypothetical protein
MFESLKSGKNEQNKDYEFGTYFGQHSQTNMSFLAYPSSFLKFENDHYHFVQTSCLLTIQNLVIKLGKNMVQIGEIYHQLSRLDKGHRNLQLIHIYYDVHSSEKIVKDKEYYRCLIHIPKASIQSKNVYNKSIEKFLGKKTYNEFKN